MSDQTNDFEFIQSLRSLVPDEAQGRPGNRGKLAVLRRGAGERPGDDWRVYPVLSAHLADEPDWPPGRFLERNWARFVVASLFALHPDHGRNAGSLGATCRRIGTHESAQQRFIALLNSRRDDLPNRLRQMIRLAHSEQAPVDYILLLQNLRQWEHPDHWVQERWARDYWRYIAADDTSTTEE